MGAVYTIGEIARRLDEDKDRIGYVIASRSIAHVGRAGGYRLFDEAACHAVRQAIEEIDARRIAHELVSEASDED